MNSTHEDTYGDRAKSRRDGGGGRAKRTLLTAFGLLATFAAGAWLSTSLIDAPEPVGTTLVVEPAAPPLAEAVEVPSAPDMAATPAEPLQATEVRLTDRPPEMDAAPPAPPPPPIVNVTPPILPPVAADTAPDVPESGIAPLGTAPPAEPAAPAPIVAAPVLEPVPAAPTAPPPAEEPATDAVTTEAEPAASPEPELPAEIPAAAPAVAIAADPIPDVPDNSVAPPAPAEPTPAVGAEEAMPPATERPAGRATGRYSVQIGSFSVPENAERLVRLLNGQGFEAYAFDWTDSAGKSWRVVRVGRVPNRRDAQALLKDVEAKTRQSGEIVRLRGR